MEWSEDTIMDHRNGGEERRRVNEGVEEMYHNSNFTISKFCRNVESQLVCFEVLPHPLPFLMSSLH